MDRILTLKSTAYCAARVPGGRGLTRGFRVQDSLVPLRKCSPAASTVATALAELRKWPGCGRVSRDRPPTHLLTVSPCCNGANPTVKKYLSLLRVTTFIQSKTMGELDAK